MMSEDEAKQLELSVRLGVVVGERDRLAFELEGATSALNSMTERCSGLEGQVRSLKEGMAREYQARIEADRLVAKLKGEKSDLLDAIRRAREALPQ